MINKKEAEKILITEMDKFWVSLAYSAPELYEFHWANFKIAMKNFLEGIYQDDQDD